jgi:hypothetical protein
VAGCGRVLCGAVSHGLLWCGRDFAARRGDAWFAQVWSRKARAGQGFCGGARFAWALRGSLWLGVTGISRFI